LVYIDRDSKEFAAGFAVTKKRETNSRNKMLKLFSKFEKKPVAVQSYLIKSNVFTLISTRKFFFIIGPQG
jgi:hypothetical protein